MVQNPSLRPGRPARLRPTWASHLLQKRLRSGTSGLSSTADCGSGRGTTGTDTSPAPSRPRVGALPPVRELRTETAAVEWPVRVRASLPETERREATRPDDERPDAELPDADPPDDDRPEEDLPEEDRPDGADDGPGEPPEDVPAPPPPPPAAACGAMPQVSQ
ncbi:hypothetical protein GCM10027168_52780 [Streptomyces capparidis]